MKLDAGTRVDTAMLIRRPVSEVFEAFVDPAVTTKFWFTGSTGKLEKGKEVEWTWEMYGVTAAVLVQEMVPGKKIAIEWGPKGAPGSHAEWTFEPHGERATFVTVAMDGFTGEDSAVFNSLIDSVSGFCWVLAGAKAWLEHRLQLNLVPDRFPKGK